MSERPAKRPRRFQFNLLTILALTAVVATGIAIILANPVSWPEWTTFAIIPFVIGMGVGMVSRSRAQLFIAPFVAAAIAPVPWSLLVALFGPNLNSNVLLEFFATWAMLSVIVLLFGGLAALAGSAFGYVLTNRKKSR